MDLSKNSVVRLNVTSYSSDGSGVCRADSGEVVFVPQSAVGDELEVRILKVKKNCCYGKIERIISPSPERIEPDCKVFSKCGGCAFRHLSLDEELRLKRQRVFDVVTRIGGVKNAVIKPIIENGRVNRYRNKAQYPIRAGESGEPIFGFYAFHSHRIIECGDCLLQPELFSRAVEAVKKFVIRTGAEIYDEKTGKGRLRHLYLRYGELSGELMLCLVVNSNGLKHEELLVQMLTSELPELKTVVINSNREKTNVILGKKNRVIYGCGYITDVLCGLKFKISPSSFWQVNRAQAEKLYAKAAEYADPSPDGVLLDLYCGTGTIGLTMARSCKELIGVELVPSAVADAEENAAMNNIRNARFICSDAAAAAEKLIAEGVSPDVIILDPPKKGCGSELIEAVFKMEPDRIVYVSCDPATLARDLKLFESGGYSALEITPCDMFTRTAHIECVALISKAIWR